MLKVKYVTQVKEARGVAKAKTTQNLESEDTWEMLWGGHRHYYHVGSYLL